VDENIKHICNPIGINAMSRARMVEYGICTIPDLLQIREQIETKTFNCLWSDVKKNLLLTIKWVENNQNADIMRDFDEQVFESIFNNNKDD
jgi:hypothetical protein